MNTYTNPVIAITDVDHGDPAVLKYNGIYYLYHTDGHAIPVYRSMDLVNWEKMGVALHASEDPTHWAQIDLWAPEIIHDNGLFYMYVTGAMKNEEGKGDDRVRHIGVAMSQSPLGPFQLAEQPLTNEWSIDAHPFKDDDGQFYMYYNVRNEFTKGPNGVIGTGNVVDRMIDLTTLEGNPTMVVKPEYPWEGNKDHTFFWNEGPFVKKHNGTYYQMYSAGFFGDDTYGLYYATSKQPMGNKGMDDKGWCKWGNGKPILKTNDACFGPGHHVVVKGPNGVDDYFIYHGYQPEENVRRRRVYVGKFHWEEDHICLEEPTQDPIPLPSQPTVDCRLSLAVEKINATLEKHLLADYFFETSLICQTSEKNPTVSGKAFYQDEKNYIHWDLAAAEQMITLMVMKDGQEILTKQRNLPEEFKQTAFHLMQIEKRKGKLCLAIDHVQYFAIEIPAEFTKGIVQLDVDEAAGTILTRL